MKPYKITANNPIEEIYAIDQKVKDRAIYGSDYLEFFEAVDELDKVVSVPLSDTEGLFLLDDVLLNKVSSLLTKMGYKIEVKDATKDIFYNELNVSATPIEFKTFVDNYIFENFDSNDVLDKISLLGIDSLTDIDKKILKTV